MPQANDPRAFAPANPPMTGATGGVPGGAMTGATGGLPASADTGGQAARGTTARPADAADAACPLTEAHFQMLRHWSARYRPVRKAARVAMGSAVTILAVAALAVPFTAFSPDFTSLAITAGLCIIGYLEYAGARKMRLGDPAAASHLGWNQVIFLSLICLYCISRMLDTSVDSYISPEARSQLSDVPELAKQIESLVPLAVRGFYLLVIVLSVAFQGGLAWYYFTRRKPLEALQQSTPAWIRRLFQEISGA